MSPQTATNVFEDERWIYPEDEYDDEHEEEEEEEENITPCETDEEIVVDGVEMILRGNKCYTKTGEFHAIMIQDE